MKTRHAFDPYMKMHISFFIFMMLLLLVIYGKTRAQGVPVAATRKQADPYFPTKGKFNVGFLTTYSGINPPPVLIGDVAYGLSNKLSLGLVGGTTGTMLLCALRMNAILFQKESFRVLLRMSTIYYPERAGTFLFDKRKIHFMPWMLSMAFADAEWKTQKGFRWSVGLGMMETHCVDDMKKWFSNSEFHHTAMPEVFNTVQGGVTIPISKKFLIHPEVVVAMKGAHLVEQGKFKVTFPINPYLNLIYCF